VIYNAVVTLQNLSLKVKPIQVLGLYYRSFCTLSLLCDWTAASTGSLHSVSGTSGVRHMQCGQK